MDYEYLRKLSALFEEAYGDGYSHPKKDKEMSACIKKWEKDLKKFNAVMDD